MRLPSPEVGMVIRYAYLWADERDFGSDEASKDRPTLVLAVAVISESGRTEVMVLPITHAPPRRATDAVVFPDALKSTMGLDEVPSWIVTTEANAFVWPGPDIRPAPGRSPASPVYGRLPPALLKQIARSYLDNRKRQKRLVTR